jgi:hypothetical protein
MKADALAAPDKFGTDQPYSIADEDDDEVKLEQCMDRIAASLPFHYHGSLSSICRFISIFSCIHRSYNLSAIGWMELSSQICLPSHRTRKFRCFSYSNIESSEMAIDVEK